MVAYHFTKLVDTEKLQAQILEAGLDTVSHLDTVAAVNLTIYFPEALNEDQQNQLAALVAAHSPVDPLKLAMAQIDQQRNAGYILETRFSAVLALAGIQSDPERSNEIRFATLQFRDALKSGFLVGAIHELRQIPDEAKDDIYMNNARILSFINLIEQILGLPLSEEV